MWLIHSLCQEHSREGGGLRGGICHLCTNLLFFSNRDLNILDKCFFYN